MTSRRTSTIVVLSLITKGEKNMSNSKSARTSTIMHNIKNGVYVRMTKFANYGSVIEDSIIAQQREADRRLKEIQAQRSLRKAKGVA